MSYLPGVTCLCPSSDAFFTGGCYWGRCSYFRIILGGWQLAVPGPAVRGPQKDPQAACLSGAMYGKGVWRPFQDLLRLGGRACMGSQREDPAAGLGLGRLKPPLPWGCFPLASLPLCEPADASDAKARERRRGGPLPTSSSKEASEAGDPR